ncbi:MAG: DUF3572 domain-containing protein [Pseudomonadota bacterium]
MTGAMAGEPADRLALDVLSWMAEQPDLLGRFMAASGASPDDLRTAMHRPEFLGFVLDHLLSDEAALLAFAADRGVPPDAPARARAGLPGGDLPEWT